MEGMGIAAGSLSGIKVKHLKGFASVPPFAAYESQTNTVQNLAT